MRVRVGRHGQVAFAPTCARWAPGTGAPMPCHLLCCRRILAHGAAGKRKRDGRVDPEARPEDGNDREAPAGPPVRNKSWTRSYTLISIRRSQPGAMTAAKA